MRGGGLDVSKYVAEINRKTWKAGDIVRLVEELVYRLVVPATTCCQQSAFQLAYFTGN